MARLFRRFIALFLLSSGLMATAAATTSWADIFVVDQQGTLCAHIPHTHTILVEVSEC